MLGTKNTTLQEKIIAMLIKKKLSAKSILVEIKKLGLNYSIQAIYDQLRILVSDDVVLKQKNIYSLNKDWLIKIKHLFQVREYLEFEEKQKNTYLCNNILHIDKLWKNLFYSLQKDDQNIFIYNPDPFWHFIDQREESEKIFYKEQKQHPSMSYCVVGGTEEHYQNYKKQFSNKSFKIESKTISSMPNNIHITIIGDYLLYAKVDEKISDKIRNLFSQKTSEEMLKEKINVLATKKSKHKLVIENNPKKALILKKRIARIFFSEKTTKEMFI